MKGVRHTFSKDLLEDTYYSPFIFSTEVFAANLRFIFSKPKVYFSTLLYIVRQNITNFLVLVKTLAVFPKAVRYARMIHNQGVHHIHSHWATIPTTVAVIISRLTDLPFSFTAHAIDIYQDQTMLEEKVKQSTFIVTCTQDNKRFLEHLCRNVCRDKIHVNYHGVDLRTLFEPLSPDGDSPYLILSVGRIEESKGFKYLLEACHILRQKQVQFRCLIIGDGPLRKKIQYLIQKLNLHDVQLTGALAFEEVLSYYKKATVFVLPAVSELHWGIPNVIIEAMAMGVPVVTTPLPAMPEIIENERTGLLVREKDPVAIAGAIENLFISSELRAAIRSNARKKVEKDFDVRKNAEALIEIFEKYI